MKTVAVENLTLVGPDKARIFCDFNEIYTDDPGRGTPCMVHWKDYSGTFTCCINEKRIDGHPLPNSIYKWLREIEVDVSNWLYDAIKTKRKN